MTTKSCVVGLLLGLNFWKPADLKIASEVDRGTNFVLRVSKKKAPVVAVAPKTVVFISFLMIPIIEDGADVDSLQCMSE